MPADGVFPCYICGRTGALAKMKIGRATNARICTFCGQAWKLGPFSPVKPAPPKPTRSAWDVGAYDAHSLPGGFGT